MFQRFGKQTSRSGSVCRTGLIFILSLIKPTFVLNSQLKFKEAEYEQTGKRFLSSWKGHDHPVRGLPQSWAQWRSRPRRAKVLVTMSRRLAIVSSSFDGYGLGVITLFWLVCLFFVPSHQWPSLRFWDIGQSDTLGRSLARIPRGSQPRFVDNFYTSRDIQITVYNIFFLDWKKLFENRYEVTYSNDLWDWHECQNLIDGCRLDGESL